MWTGDLLCNPGWPWTCDAPLLSLPSARLQAQVTTSFTLDFSLLPTLPFFLPLFPSPPPTLSLSPFLSLSSSFLRCRGGHPWACAYWASSLSLNHAVSPNTYVADWISSYFMRLLLSKHFLKIIDLSYFLFGYSVCTMCPAKSLSLSLNCPPHQFQAFWSFQKDCVYLFQAAQK